MVTLPVEPHTAMPVEIATVAMVTVYFSKLLSKGLTYGGVLQGDWKPIREGGVKTCPCLWGKKFRGQTSTFVKIVFWLNFGNETYCTDMKLHSYNGDVKFYQNMWLSWQPRSKVTWEKVKYARCRNLLWICILSVGDVSGQVDICHCYHVEWHLC